MMIDKRLVNTVPESKKWILINALWSFLGLLGGIVSALAFGLCLEQAFNYRLNGAAVASYTAILLFALIVRAAAGSMAVKASYRTSVKVKHHLRTLIYRKLAGMPLNQVNRQSTSAVIQVASEGVEQIEIYFGRYLPQLFYSLLAPLTLFAFLIFLNVPAASVLLLCVPLIPMSIIAVNKIAKKLLAKYWAIYVGLGSSFLDNLQGLVTLKAYQDDEYKSRQMDIEAENFRTVTMKVLTMQLNSVSLMDLLAYGGAAAGIITALLQYRDGALSVFGVIVFILLASEFFIPLRLLGSFFHVAMNGKAASEKIFALLDEPVESDRNTERFEPQGEMTVSIEDLHFGYSQRKKAIDGLSLVIEPKRLSVFVGRSGSGKSTLVSLLMGFYRPDSGSILFNRQNSRNLDRTSLYRHVALVSHNSYVFKGTLRENMLMAKPGATDEEIYHALERVNLSQFVVENGGLDMPLLSRGTNLSGGQIQRLALARAVLRAAQLYIFDEATSNIDVESEEIILQFIQQLKQSKTIIMISHRLANAVNADCIYVLRQGKLIERGTHEELMAQQTEYAQMYRQQKELEAIRTKKGVSHA